MIGKNCIQKNKYEQGQTIAVVILIMVMVLAVSVGISTRFFKSVRQATRIDSSNRALAVAEALVEHLLNTDFETLQEFIDFGSCGSDCVLTITGDDGVVASATATLTRAGDSSDPFEIKLAQGSVVEVSLDGYPDDTTISVCWDSPATGDLPSIHALLVKGTNGNYSMNNYAYNSVGSIHADNGFTDASSSMGYDNCFDIDSGSDPSALRLKTYYRDTDAYVIPESGSNLPSQGILITSVGVVDDAERTVEVLMSSPYMPAPFDYVIYHRSEDFPLSN